MTKSKYITRLKRSEGQLRGIQKMIEEERDCVDILTQLTAVRSSVDRVIELIITENLTAWGSSRGSLIQAVKFP